MRFSLGFYLLILATPLGCLADISCENIGIEPVVVVHGGAGNIADAFVPAAKEGVKVAARIGYMTLKSTRNVVDAVQQAVRALESNPQFNAGFGSVLTWEGKVEMDAAIMNGADLNAGCVSVVRDICHPIDMARCVMDRTRHKYLAGEGAMVFAREQGFKILPEGSLVTNKSRQALEDYKNSLNSTKHRCGNPLCVAERNGTIRPYYNNAVNEFGSPGTVGAVAIDECGNLAAATSTGGITGKMPGRIGDSPILGGGTYADNAIGAISATGHGETIMRYNLASRILALIKYESLSPKNAAKKALESMSERFEQPAGVIGLDFKGRVGIHFTSRRMSWAYQRGNHLHYGVDPKDDFQEIIGEPRMDAFGCNTTNTHRRHCGAFTRL